MEDDKLNNCILVLRCQRRDELAFRELVNRWEPRLFYYLRRIIDNENAIWDVLQETWLAVFKNIYKLKDPLNFPSWLYKISHNKAVNWLQKENKYIQMTDEQMSEYYENNYVITPFKERAERVHELLGKLNFTHREVLTLFFLEGFSIKEMAQILEVSVGTVKSRLYYAKHKLFEGLKGANNA